MRKSFIIAAVALTLSATASAQDKTDRVYGPQKGHGLSAWDWTP